MYKCQAVDIGMKEKSQPILTFFLYTFTLLTLSIYKSFIFSKKVKCGVGRFYTHPVTHSVRVSHSIAGHSKIVNLYKNHVL